MIGIPITIGGALLSDPLIVFFSGEKYLPSGLLFKVLILSVVPFFLSNIYINVLTVRNAKMLNILYFSLFALNVVVNFLLIPIWAAQGAAWATVLCEWVGLGWGLWLIRRDLQVKMGTSVIRTALTALCASLLMGFCIYWDPKLYWLVLGPVVYGLLLWALRGLDEADKKSIRSVFRVSVK